MNTNLIPQLWSDSSTAKLHPVWIKSADPLDEFIQSRKDLLSVRSTRDLERRPFGMLEVGSGLKTNASIVAAPSVVGYGLSYPKLIKPVDFHFGDSSTASGVALSKIVSLFIPMNNAWEEISWAIDNWGKLETDWDGDGAVPPAPFALENARSFIDLTIGSGAQPPKPFIASDGEIGFRWRKGEAVASVSFLDDGHMVVFCMSPNLSKPIKIDEPYDTGLNLTDLFKSLVFFA